MNQEVCIGTWTVHGVITSASEKSVRALRTCTKIKLFEIKAMKEITKSPRHPWRTEGPQSAVSPKRQQSPACPHQFRSLGRGGCCNFCKHSLATVSPSKDTKRHTQPPTSDIAQESRTTEHSQNAQFKHAFPL